MFHISSSFTKIFYWVTTGWETLKCFSFWTSFMVLKHAPAKVRLIFVLVWSSARAKKWDFLLRESHSGVIYIPLLAWTDIQLFTALSPLMDESAAVFLLIALLNRRWRGSTSHLQMFVITVPARLNGCEVVARDSTHSAAAWSSGGLLYWFWTASRGFGGKKLPRLAGRPAFMRWGVWGGGKCATNEGWMNQL